MKFVIEAFNDAVTAALVPESITPYHGHQPDSAGFSYVRFFMANSDDAQYHSCEYQQTYSFAVECVSTSEITSADRLERITEYLETYGVTMRENTFVVVKKGPDSLTEDPDKTETGETIWIASGLFYLTISKER